MYMLKTTVLFSCKCGLRIPNISLKETNGHLNIDAVVQSTFKKSVNYVYIGMLCANADVSHFTSLNGLDKTHSLLCHHTLRLVDINNLLKALYLYG